MNKEFFEKKSMLSRCIFFIVGGLLVIGIFVVFYMIQIVYVVKIIEKYQVLNPQGIRELCEWIFLLFWFKDLKGKIVYFVCQDKFVQIREFVECFRKSMFEINVVFRMKKGWVIFEDIELRDELK